MESVGVSNVTVPSDTNETSEMGVSPFNTTDVGIKNHTTPADEYFQYEILLNIIF